MTIIFPCIPSPCQLTVETPHISICPVQHSDFSNLRHCKFKMCSSLVKLKLKSMTFFRLHSHGEHFRSRFIIKCHFYFLISGQQSYRKPRKVNNTSKGKIVSINCMQPSCTLALGNQIFLLILSYSLPPKQTHIQVIEKADTFPQEKSSWLPIPPLQL